MSSVTNRIPIRRAIEDVFAVLTDVEKTGIWFPGDVDEHWTSPPPHGVGSTRHAVVRMRGRRTENDAVVTEYDPPYRAAMAGTSPNAPFVVWPGVGSRTRDAEAIDGIGGVVEPEAIAPNHGSSVSCRSGSVQIDHGQSNR